MKSLKEYINNISLNEDYETIHLNEVTAKYDVEPDELYIQAPDTFQESDIQQYLDDRFLVNLPSGVDYADEFFRNNAGNIYDAYFEYRSFMHMHSGYKPSGKYIEWDDKYAQNTTSETKLDYFRINGLKYIISFDRFDILDNDDSDENIQNTLNLIFKTTESNETNKYPLTIKIKEDNIKYKK